MDRLSLSRFTSLSSHLLSWLLDTTKDIILICHGVLEEAKGISMIEEIHMIETEEMVQEEEEIDGIVMTTITMGQEEVPGTEVEGIVTEAETIEIIETTEIEIGIEDMDPDIEDQLIIGIEMIEMDMGIDVHTEQTVDQVTIEIMME
jgi:hypothetical protein